MGGPFVAQCIHQTPVCYRQVGLLEHHLIKDNIRVTVLAIVSIYS